MGNNKSLAIGLSHSVYTYDDNKKEGEIMKQKIQHNLIESLIDIVTHQLETLTPYSHKLHLKIINHLRPEFKAELFQYQITNAENN